MLLFVFTVLAKSFFYLSLDDCVWSCSIYYLSEDYTFYHGTFCQFIMNKNLLH